MKIVNNNTYYRDDNNMNLFFYNQITNRMIFPLEISLNRLSLSENIWIMNTLSPLLEVSFGAHNHQVGISVW